MQRYISLASLLVSFALSALFVGCAEHPHTASMSVATGEDVQPIVHGRRDLSDRFDAVVKLSFVNNGTFCSGTLIAPDTVMTAAHCVPQAWNVGSGVQRLTRDQWLEVQFHRGPMQLAARTARAVAVHEGYRGLVRCVRPDGAHERRACQVFARHCGVKSVSDVDACISDLSHDVRRGLGLSELWPTHDMALVFLNEPVTDIAPARIVDDTCCTNLVHPHAPLVIAGYGQQGETAYVRGELGTILHGANRIVDTGIGELRVDGGDAAHPCFGDSGGPAYAEVDRDGQPTLVQVGIASRVWDYHVGRGCASGLAYTRIDTEGDFIGTAMRDAVIEGVRHPDHTAVDPKFTPKGETSESCRQTSASWSWIILLGLWLVARRSMHRAV